MDSWEIRNRLEKIIRETKECNLSIIPARLREELNAFQWGKYGWVSPASLIVTATWYKWIYPTRDCCKIWAQDETGQPIEGGYSIRTEDETITIPILAKYELCAGFCSPNSGMQGSRAIEKMRTMRRLNRDFNSSQKTVFDLKLFAAILNDINELSQDESFEVLKYLVCIAKEIHENLIKANKKLTEEKASSGVDIMQILSEIHDPELTKCVVAACIDRLFSPFKLCLEGVADQKTAADARAQKPGDLCLLSPLHDNLVIAAFEVKDKTQSIDWNNIERAKRIIRKFPSITMFMFVLENRDSATSKIVNEISKTLRDDVSDNRPICILSVHDLLCIALSISSQQELLEITSKFISIAPAIKPETKSRWISVVY